MKALLSLIVIALMLFTGCKCGGKKSMKGDEEINTTDFISFFDDITLPQSFNGAEYFTKKASDSALIETKILQKFVNDSIFKKEFVKGKKVYAAGKFKNGEEETYLLLRAISGTKQVLYVTAFNKEKKFVAAMPLVSNSSNESAAIDKKFSFTKTVRTKTSDGAVFPVNTVYAFNNAGLFMVILTDGLPAGTDMPIINPIDTVSRKMKWTADYARNKRNFISFRDGARPQELRFFLHIEKKEDHFCDGELKGEAKMIGADSALYTGNGDPCSVGFKFSNNSVVITETTCGNRHGLECSFDGSYTKQKTAVKPKEKTEKKPKTSK